MAGCLLDSPEDFMSYTRTKAFLHQGTFSCLWEGIHPEDHNETRVWRVEPGKTQASSFLFARH